MAKELEKEQVLISGIGLPDTDISVIRSVFLLSSELQERFTFLGNDPDVSGSIVFVNADHEPSMNKWQVLAERGFAANPIFVGSEPPKNHQGIFLARPLSLRKLIETLDRLTSSSDVAGCAPAAAALRILVVDDSYSVRTYMAQILPRLTDRPVSIGFADSAEEAKKQLSDAVYDLVFLDVIMPGLDGYKLCKWVKSNFDYRVVMLTSKKSPFDKVRGTMSGCNDYVTKPPKVERLRAILSVALASHASLGAAPGDAPTHAHA